MRSTSRVGRQPIVPDNPTVALFSGRRAGNSAVPVAGVVNELAL